MRFIRRRPRQNLHPRRALGRHEGQRRGVVDEQPHTLAALRQIHGQAPADARVAEVVDDAAVDIPRQGWHRAIIEAETIAADDRICEAGCEDVIGKSTIPTVAPCAKPSVKNSHNIESRMQIFYSSICDFDLTSNNAPSKSIT